MTPTDDDAMDNQLRQNLGPRADDTAPLSRAVLSRLATPARQPGFALGEVLTAPVPATGLLLGLLALTVAVSYALAPAAPDEVGLLLQVLDLGA